MQDTQPTTAESQAVLTLLKQTSLDSARQQRVHQKATAWIEHLRGQSPNLMAQLLSDFGLNSTEGWALMSLAECLLRIPDESTALRFARCMLDQGHWVNSDHPSTDWPISLAEHALQWGQRYLKHTDASWLHRLADPIFLSTLRRSLHVMAGRFVWAEDLQQALRHREEDFSYSFDMLGESALGERDAELYLNRYAQALQTLGQNRRPHHDSISIKLSALHARFEAGKDALCLPALIERTLWLAQMAAQHRIDLTLDAETCDTQDLALKVIQALRKHPALSGWDGLGIAVQAYQIRAPEILQKLDDLAVQQGICLNVRLVKGAYWDSEIKLAQHLALRRYPVYTRKAHTDLAYLACAKQLLNARHLRAQFATHNAHTLAWIHEVAEGRTYEVQKLHGMGDALHRLHLAETGCSCRTYAPVGSFDVLLPYLLRRLLENVSNQSFVAQLAMPELDTEEIMADPWLKATANPSPGQVEPHLAVTPLLRAHGFGLDDQVALTRVADALAHPKTPDQVHSLIQGQPLPGVVHTHSSRADGRILSQIHWAEAAVADLAMQAASLGASAWNATPVTDRAQCLLRMADLLDREGMDYLSLLVHEGGKVIADALAEVREACDLCRYYSAQAEQLLAAPINLPHITGERNTLIWQGRGVFLCISPWNFPLAICLGQVAAALVSGNTVVVKPALQTPLLAERMVRDLLACGIPTSALQLILGQSDVVGDPLLRHPRLAGVAMTGSTQTGQTIHRILADHHRAILPLIAETGGLNVMIADSTALPQHVVRDVITSAFNSAGQRCSSCRILFIQDSMQASVLPLLSDAVGQLVVGNPGDPTTDIGPVIDMNARDTLRNYQRELDQRSVRVAMATCPETGCFVAPSVHLCTLETLPHEEVFGPILHVVTYRPEDLPQVHSWVRDSGYGLTLGLQSRVPEQLQLAQQPWPVGNLYINRNQIGAAVGCQPFGGQGLSGTGFKAGGPHYLLRFSVERAICENLTSLGINTELAQDPQLDSRPD
ncbi:MAG: bifunctional proline dehydrogenase/L-glutamate gamma-semialdehyde dehydrogenase PutA [Pseudomonadales bacterium]|nr:bifunctional proline dehydrogenase/L-glutamate gamma-semialdehyde dehydrogenase PutA [Pseudomonadales bacterium]